MRVYECRNGSMRCGVSGVDLWNKQKGGELKMGKDDILHKIQGASVVLVMAGGLIWLTLPHLEKIGGAIAMTGMIGIGLTVLLNPP